MNDMQIRSIVSQMEKTCFLCKFIREDLDKNGKLTGYPIDAFGGSVFPVDGKKKHLELEKLSIDNRLTA